MKANAAPRNEDELEDLLSAPSDADRETLASLDGDLLILGVAGKMGPSLARRARRALDPARRVIGVARFSNPEVRRSLDASGIETIGADLLQPGTVDRLPDCANVIFMAARKFGSTGNESLTWAINTFVPGLVAERYRGSRIAAFSTGNVYPLVRIAHGGASESTPASPVGEYAQSALARERLFEYHSLRYSTPVALLRLNYAIDMRYGVLLDIGRKVFSRRPVDLRMGMVNVIWQGDANSVCLRSLAEAQSPPLVLNVTGPETVSVRYLAERFGRHFGNEPAFSGEEEASALLSHAGLAHRLFGYPSVTLEQMIEWTAQWIAMGGPTWDKPTHFETRDGKF